MWPPYTRIAGHATKKDIAWRHRPGNGVANNPYCCHGARTGFRLSDSASKVLQPHCRKVFWTTVRRSNTRADKSGARSCCSPRVLRRLCATERTRMQVQRPWNSSARRRTCRELVSRRNRFWHAWTVSKYPGVGKPLLRFEPSIPPDVHICHSSDTLL